MIEVEREDPELSTFEVENCVFCRNPTSFWYRAKDVACCPECAAEATPEDVPDKQTWCRREQIAIGSDALEVIASGEVHPMGSHYEVQ